ncbi:MAG: putative metal-binding motif-containing protein [Alphaproteobacteria bacterium]|nr:putative metal-binding motif-containing protein [Alphaproteobacteria bacterium]
MRWWVLGLSLGLIGCGNDKDIDARDSQFDVPSDLDGDGVSPPEDCDDEDPNVSPLIEESCDEVDQDCDGQVDEGATSSWYLDSDGDGYGNADERLDTCSQPTG